jgi:hypothetical protein
MWDVTGTFGMMSYLGAECINTSSISKKDMNLIIF